MLILALLGEIVKIGTAISVINERNYIDIDGDIIFGGLFPVHSVNTSASRQDVCGKLQEGRGIHRVAAMIYAIDQVNIKMRDKSSSLYLPLSKGIGAQIFDTCGDDGYALKSSMAFIKNPLSDGPGAYQCEEGANPTNSVRLKQKYTPLAGVIGASYSTVSTAVARLLQIFHIVQISPASTSKTLSNKLSFQYFARTVPSDAYQVQLLLEIAVHFNWTFVSLLYSEGTYGLEGSEDFKKQARKQEICIAVNMKITKDSMEEALTEVRDAANFDPHGDLYASVPGKKHSRVVFLFTKNTDTKMLLAKAREMNLTGIQWVAADGWEMSSAMVEGSELAAQGALVGVLASHTVEPFEDYFKNWTLPTIRKYNTSWLYEFWEEKNNCSIPGRPNYPSRRLCRDDEKFNSSDFKADNKVQFVIDAVYALAHALHNYWKESCQLPDQNRLCDEMYADRLHSSLNKSLWSFLQNVSFTGASGQQFQFDNAGDGPPNYLIKNYVYDVETKIGEYRVVGTWNVKDLEINNSEVYWAYRKKGGSPPISRCSDRCAHNQKYFFTDIPCCWSCNNCSANEHVDAVVETECKACPVGHWPEPDKIGCYSIKDKHLEYLQWESLFSIGPCVLSVIGMISTVIVLRVFLKYNDTPLVKAAGRELTYCILGGVFLCYAVTFVIVGKPHAATCALRRVIVGLGLCTLYASLLVKTNRIYRIFNSAQKGIQQVQFISPVSQLIMTGGLIGVQMIGSLVWLIVEIPGVMPSYPDPQPRALLNCIVNNRYFLISLSYNVILIAICTIYAVLTRTVPENFNEAKHIGFTMYTTCIIWLASIPIYYGTGNNYEIQTCTLCLSISLSATVALVLLYGPKIYIILVEPEKNVKQRGPIHRESMRTVDSIAGSGSPSMPLLKNRQFGGSQRTYVNSTESTPAPARACRETDYNADSIISEDYHPEMSIDSVDLNASSRSHTLLLRGDSAVAAVKRSPRNSLEPHSPSRVNSILQETDETDSAVVPESESDHPESSATIENSDVGELVNSCDNLEIFV